MSRILIVSILLILVVSSGAFAASTRWNALGGDHRFIIDTTNYTIYPGRLTQFGNALFIIPTPNFLDNNVASGALVNVTKDMTLALHYNLASAGAKNLSKALAGLSDPDELTSAERGLTRADEGTAEWFEARKSVAALSQNERLAALDIRPFPDLFWGMRTGNIGLGVRLALAMDSDSDAASVLEEPIMKDEDVVGMETKPVEEITASATAFDLNVGATMYETPAGDLDLGLSVGMQSFSGDDPNHDIEIGSTGGLDLACNARLSKPLDEEAYRTLISLANLNIGSLPSAEYDIEAAPDVAEVSYTKGDIGVGFRQKVKEKGMVLAGVVGGYGATTYTPTTTMEIEPAEEGGEVTLETKELPETTDTSLNATVLAGCEFPISKWLIVRGGANVRFAAITDEMVVREGIEDWITGEETVTEAVRDKKSTSVGYYYNMGIRAVFNGLLVDVLLARNIVHRGPYFLTGAAGNWATNVCVTYKF